jgi:threonine dehydratase
MPALDIADVKDAAAHFDETIVRHTPIDSSHSIGAVADADVYLKFEHLQRTGSFKTRGASNKMRAIKGDDSTVERVVAASAGNHAQGVALAATDAGFETTIVMPADAPQAKIDATREYGASVILHGTDFQEAMAHVRTLVDDHTLFVHAYDDPDIIAGQGTIGLEILDDVPNVDTIVAPIGGGGLISGIGLAVKSVDPDVRIVGVQAAEAATVSDSLQKGTPQVIDSTDTIADGIATGGISELTLDLIDSYVDEVISVSESDIASGIVFLMERSKQIVEAAGAATVAPLLTGQLDVAGEVVVPVLTGGNLDISMLQTVLTHELTERNRLLELRVRIDDRPGVMNDIAGVIGGHNANIRTVHHHRANAALDVGEAFLTFEVETSGIEHTDNIKQTIREHGYEVTQVN